MGGVSPRWGWSCDVLELLAVLLFSLVSGAFCSGAVVRRGLLAFYQQDRGINVSSAMLCGFGTSALIPTAPEFHQNLPHWGMVLGVGADLMCRGGTCWPPSIYCLSRTVCARGGAFTHRPFLSSGVLRTGVWSALYVTVCCLRFWPVVWYVSPYVGWLARHGWSWGSVLATCFPLGLRCP